MKSECLPFRQIPHTTQLFADFLSNPVQLQQFYPRPPFFKEWFKDEASAIRYDSARRERVSAILQRQNESWEASARTLENIARLRAGASALVTGQQVGLFGGPMFSIYKALTAVKLADFATQNGVDCVPVFWLATEDHDLAEVNHVSLPGSDGSFRHLAATAPARADAPVGTVTFGDEMDLLVNSAAESLGDSEIVDTLRRCYRPGETYGSAFARLFARLFADFGVILLDASDPELHHISQPVYREAIERSAELDKSLLARGQALEAAGYHQQVKVTPSSALLFALQDGARIPVHRRPNGEAGDSEFVIRDEKVSQAELLRRIAAAPQDFSANVLLRPVVQDYLLPTLAYTGGAAEVAYFAQAAVVYEALLERITPVIPRFSATIVESKPASLLERYGLSLINLFHGSESLRELLAAHALPTELQSAFEGAEASLRQSLGKIRGALERLDKTLADATDNAAAKMQHQLESLRARAARAELRQTEVLTRHAELLSSALYPNKTLQEREIPGIYFLARQGTELLRGLYDTINPDCQDHQIITL
ncbi:MAG: bacillithiol biosynthesis cysteine-adding enzyme BshC [Terriglobales bacterium]